MRGKLGLVLAVLVLLTIPVIAAIWTQMVPKYRATAEVRVRSIIPYLIFETENSGAIPQYTSFVKTQSSIFRNSAVLQRALEKRGIKNTQWYKSPPKSLLKRLGRSSPPSRIDRLKDSLSANPRKGTELIDVTFVDTSAEEAKLILDAILDSYIEFVSEMSDATDDSLYSQLVEQHKSLEAEIAGREEITAGLLGTSLRTTNPQELISAKRIRLDEMQAGIGELRQRVALLEWELQQADANDSNEVAVDATGGTEHQLTRAKYEEELLLAELRKQQAEFDRLYRDTQLLDKENRELQHKRDLLDAVRQRLDHKNMERDIPGPIRILSRASLPSEPYNDHRILYTGIVLGFCLAIGSGTRLLQRKHTDNASRR